MTVYGAVTGLFFAMVTAVTGATPWAVGVPGLPGAGRLAVGRGRVLLRRAQGAADTVRSAAATRAGILDEPPTDMALAAQEWDIVIGLREHARLRARRAILLPED